MNNNNNTVMEKDDNRDDDNDRRKNINSHIYFLVIWITISTVCIVGIYYSIIIFFNSESMNYFPFNLFMVVIIMAGGSVLLLAALLGIHENILGLINM
jgi:hypothetical protein